MAIIQRFHEGGVFMYAILAFALCTAAMVVERFVALYVKYKLPTGNLREAVLEFVRKGDWKGAESYCHKVGETAGLGKILEIGFHIRGNAGGEEELQLRMDERLNAEIRKLDKRTAFLAMFGNVATLLGLLGTISGMIQSFAAVANSNPADRATLLSKGISEAMNCTAFGLLVAIPALVAYAIYQNKTDRIVNALVEATTNVYHDILFLSERGQRSQPGSV